MKIIKDHETIQVFYEDMSWTARIGQCYVNSLGENVYKLDNDYILMEYCERYGLMKIVGRNEKWN